MVPSLAFNWAPPLTVPSTAEQILRREDDGARLVFGKRSTAMPVDETVETRVYFSS
jgi:hypothetical protein